MIRLNTIVSFINNNDVVADIGCDHGYLLKLSIENKNIILSNAGQSGIKVNLKLDVR